VKVPAYVAKAITARPWVPTKEQNEALDWLAMGYSMNATSRNVGIAVGTVWNWVNDAQFSEQFRKEITQRAAVFQENLEAIEDQQMLQATAILGKALAGEVPRDPDGNIPIEYSAALELLRATRWKQRSGGHKQFGAS